MNNVLEDSLFVSQNRKFDEIQSTVRQFSAEYVGNSIIKDNIFAVIQNYARKKEIALEMLRYPIHDDELWALTFLKQDTIFVCVNTALPLCKQFFAAAHELYHIYCYVESADQSYIKNGSMLDSATGDETGRTQEDLEANAFAGLLLMPDQLLHEQILLYGLDKDLVTVDSVLMLMDMFAMPYKAVVLRLFESGNISHQQAEKLLEVGSADVMERVSLTGKAKRWQLDGKGTESFGTLLEKVEYNRQHEYLTESREKEDVAYLTQLKKSTAWIEGGQIEVKRYALLDTDFISKTHSVQDDGGNHLIDRVMELPGYEFFCHAQIVTELNRYNADAPIWLSEKIGAQKIKSYTDQEILESLSLVRGPLACATYTQMLKLACDAFSRDYFSEHYRALEDADYATISNEDYLKELQLLDIEVGKKNNLGEIKSFVLLQVLSVMLGEQIYVFCSDDKNARNRATNFEDVRCTSLVSAFSRLKEEANWVIDDAEPYIEALVEFYQEHNQVILRVMEPLKVADCSVYHVDRYYGKSLRKNLWS